MRTSSKTRSRNKNNNNNNNNNRRQNPGNVINRVFDSSGPEGRVRGTPQQIIDKYQSLASDAILAGDRIAHENHLQHSEHYSRLLVNAQREMDAKREQQQIETEAKREQQQKQNENKIVNSLNDNNNDQSAVLNIPIEKVSNGQTEGNQSIESKVVETLDTQEEIVVTKSRRNLTKSKILEPKLNQTIIEQSISSSEEN